MDSRTAASSKQWNSSREQVGQIAVIGSGQGQAADSWVYPEVHIADGLRLESVGKVGLSQLDWTVLWRTARK
jgi:hypothetical protein